SSSFMNTMASMSNDGRRLGGCVYEKVVGRDRQRGKKGVTSWVRQGLNRAKETPLRKERISPNGNERASRPVPSSRKRIVEITRSRGRNRRRKSQSLRRNDLSWNVSNRQEGNGRENE